VNVEETIYNRGYISMLRNPAEEEEITEETDVLLKWNWHDLILKKGEACSFCKLLYIS